MNRRDFLKRTALTAAALAVTPTILDGTPIPPLGPVGVSGPSCPAGIEGFLIRSKELVIGNLLMDKKGDIYRVQCHAELFDKQAHQDDWWVTAIKSTITEPPDDTAIAVFSSAMSEGENRISVKQYYHGDE